MGPHVICNTLHHVVSLGECCLQALDATSSPAIFAAAAAPLAILCCACVRTCLSSLSVACAACSSTVNSLLELLLWQQHVVLQARASLQKSGVAIVSSQAFYTYVVLLQ